MNEMRKLMEAVEQAQTANSNETDFYTDKNHAERYGRKEDVVDDEKIVEGIFGNAMKDVGKKMTGYLPAHEGTIRFVSIKVEDVILLAQLGKETINDPKAVKIFEEIRQELIIIKRYLRKKKAEHYKKN